MKSIQACLIIVLMTTGAAGVRAWDFPLDVDIVKLQFYHGNSNSALNIRKNAGTDITVPEYDPGSSRDEKFAYVMGATPHVLAVFHVSSPDGDSLTIDAIGINGSSWDLADKAVRFSPGTGYSIEDSGYPTSFVGMNSDTSVPNSVGKQDSRMWNWRVVALDGTPCSPYSIGNTTHTYYTLLDTPQSPMAEPWTDVLDKSCIWADGATSKTNAATSITGALYDSGFTYASSNGATQYGNPFSLTNYLSDIGTYKYVNCFDMARAVVCFSNSIGCSLSVIRLGRYSDQNPLNHPVNCVDPIGTHDFYEGTPPGPTNNPIGAVNQMLDDCRTLDNGGFQYHAYAIDSNGYVWDATLKYDTGSDPDHVTGSYPGCGSVTSPTPTWTLPANVLESTYQTYLLDSFPEWSATSPTRQSASFNIE